MAQDGGSVLSEDVARHLKVRPSTIEWLCPLSRDDFTEYSDQTFLDRLSVSLTKRELSNFWPKRGPVLDGLGRTKRGDFLLMEAKAPIGEMISPPIKAGEASRKIIENALEETRAYLSIKGQADWSDTFYQYANRLAHLYLLRVLNGLPA